MLLLIVLLIVDLSKQSIDWKIRRYHLENSKKKVELQLDDYNYYLINQSNPSPLTTCQPQCNHLALLSSTSVPTIWFTQRILASVQAQHFFFVLQKHFLLVYTFYNSILVFNASYPISWGYNNTNTNYTSFNNNNNNTQTYNSTNNTNTNNININNDNVNNDNDDDIVDDDVYDMQYYPVLQRLIIIRKVEIFDIALDNKCIPKSPIRLKAIKMPEGNPLLLKMSNDYLLVNYPQHLHILSLHQLFNPVSNHSHQVIHLASPTLHTSHILLFASTLIIVHSPTQSVQFFSLTSHNSTLLHIIYLQQTPSFIQLSNNNNLFIGHHNGTTYSLRVYLLLESQPGLPNPSTSPVLQSLLTLHSPILDINTQHDYIYISQVNLLSIYKQQLDQHLNVEYSLVTSLPTVCQPSLLFLQPSLLLLQGPYCLDTKQIVFSPPTLVCQLTHVPSHTLYLNFIMYSLYNSNTTSNQQNVISFQNQQYRQEYVQFQLKFYNRLFRNEQLALVVGLFLGICGNFFILLLFILYCFKMQSRIRQLNFMLQFSRKNNYACQRNNSYNLQNTQSDIVSINSINNQEQLNLINMESNKDKISVDMI